MNKWDINLRGIRLHTQREMPYLYKHTNGNFFDDFPKISEHFAKIS